MYKSIAIPSSAAMLHFSALAFLGARNFNEFIKLILFNLFIMAEPLDRRPVRSRKLTVQFDDKIAQSLVPTKPTKPTKPAKTTQKSFKPSALPTPASLSAEPIVLEDAVEELCSQTEGLGIEDDLKTKKKAKAVEIARLATLGLQGVMEEAKPLKEIQFEAFNPGEPREPKVNIPSYIDPANPLELLDLFIPPEIYTTIAENTNLYALLIMHQ
jgi:hypothetical protein